MSDMDLMNLDLLLILKEYNSENIEIEFQAFPKNSSMIDNIEMVFDMKFRDDYESEFNGVCVGPSWDDYGPGDFQHFIRTKIQF